MTVAIPWYAKIAAKLVLARIPLPYRLWKRIGVFENGPMNRPDYAMRVFKTHYEAGTLTGGFSCVEIGPGDSLFSALLSHAHGAGRTYLVDAGRFATEDLSLYRKAAEDLKSAGFDVPTEFSSVEEMLRLCHAEYLTNGVAALASIPSRSVDFIWSQAVLEHVALDHFSSMVSEWRRIIRDNGFASHTVDLKDHFNTALNNLRFSDATWESRLFRSSGFYTNRIRFGEMLQLFDRHGFSSVVTAQRRWDQMPTPRARLAPRFRDLKDEELLVSGFTAILRPKKEWNAPVDDTAERHH